jgi:hypothetical protein
MPGRLPNTCGPETRFWQTTAAKSGGSSGGTSGGTWIGKFWRIVAREDLRDSHMSLKRRLLTVSGSYWRECRNGLKGRCSTTRDWAPFCA